VYAPGTGDAIGSGGRYDELLGRFGWELPAAGFALDLDRLGEALLAAGRPRGRPVRVVVVGPPNSPRATDLRARGVVAVTLPDRASALAWARDWAFTHVLDAAEWVDAPSGATIASPLGERGER
jgi:ATP phosphoribosyltransferase regulatory subunit HisZ